MAFQACGIVTLTTDFGTKDWYVGAMKGVILSRFPACSIVDITHDVDPGDVLSAGFALKNAAPCFPPGSVHLAVVDPGVGGQRRPIVVETERFCFVGPDNGLFSPLLEGSDRGIVRVIRREDLYVQPVSGTFHGRDIFAPAAAYLAKGGDPDEIGEKIDDLIRVDLPAPRWDKGHVTGHIAHIDRFGNGVTNIPYADIEQRFGKGAALDIRIGNQRFTEIRKTYTDVSEGRPLVVVGSSGVLEVSINRGDAGRKLKLKPYRTMVIVRG